MWQCPDHFALNEPASFISSLGAFLVSSFLFSFNLCLLGLNSHFLAQRENDGLFAEASQAGGDGGLWLGFWSV